ncbi:MAG: hypothetical protein PHN52_13660 [candidate division Zixibacteria bacterium]|nr:hypothetical protein [candidate division Zixibacteria bacterium]
MKNYYNKIITNLIFLALLVCSCAKFITIEFIEKKSSKPVSVNGWIIKPDIFSIRGSAGKFTQEELNTFSVDVDVTRNKVKDQKDLLDINFENVTVIIKPDNEIIPVSLSYSCFDSYPSDKYIKKVYSNYANQYKSPIITIPEEIDTIVLKFDAVFYNGVLSEAATGSVIYDYIIVNDSTPIARIPVVIEMYRKVSSSIGINYGD